MSFDGLIEIELHGHSHTPYLESFLLPYECRFHRGQEPVRETNKFYFVSLERIHLVILTEILKM